MDASMDRHLTENQQVQVVAGGRAANSVAAPPAAAHSKDSFKQAQQVSAAPSSIATAATTAPGVSQFVAPNVAPAPLQMSGASLASLAAATAPATVVASAPIALAPNPTTTAAAPTAASNSSSQQQQQLFWQQAIQSFNFLPPQQQQQVLVQTSAALLPTTTAAAAAAPTTTGTGAPGTATAPATATLPLHLAGMSPLTTALTPAPGAPPGTAFTSSLAPLGTLPTTTATTTDLLLQQPPPVAAPPTAPSHHRHHANKRRKTAGASSTGPAPVAPASSFWMAPTTAPTSFTATAPSVVSSYSSSATSGTAATTTTATTAGATSTTTAGGMDSSSHSAAAAAAAAAAAVPQPPPPRLSDAALAAMTPAQRRRYERNLREQHRSYKISQQIKELRDVLTASNVPFKPNKFSILVSVASYIQELQRRAIMLDADHKKLFETIRQTNELVSSGQASTLCTSSDSSKADGSKAADGTTTTTTTPDGQADEDCPDFLLVQGIDYAAVFEHCPYPIGVATLDGRILACNDAFERVMGCETAGEMVQQSLFLYIRNHQEIFEAMADLLKRSSLAAETGEGVVETSPSRLLYWCGHVVSSQQLELAFNITLTNMKDGNPKYFSFSIASVG